LLLDGVLYLIIFCYFFLKKIESNLFIYEIIYRERLSKLLGSSFSRLSSSTILTTSAADGQVFAIFCKNAIVVLVLNNPTARRLRPCKRHASTAAKII
jgi:hypothetical protein